MVYSVLKRLCHWGPLTAVLIILIVSLTTIFLTSQWLPFNHSPTSYLIYSLFTFLVCATLYNLLTASLLGPGFLPFGWKPSEPSDEKYLQYCSACKGFKAPRSHHCRKCGRCCLKMEHHCPWINNCCGHYNHKNFIMFLFYAVLGSFYSSILLAIGIYRAYYVSWYFNNGDRARIVHLTLNLFLFSIFSTGLAIGVVIALGGLLYLQMKVVLLNKTSIEDWIVTKANSRRSSEFTYPYDLGYLENFKLVFYHDLGNGVYWHTKSNCNQYTLTIEQLVQKNEKRRRARLYKTFKSFTGSWFPIFSQGFKTCLNYPLTDETRIPLDVGDVISVTRWKKCWLYGEKLDGNFQETRIRGWFPRQCVMEAVINHFPNNAGDLLLNTNRKSDERKKFV